MVIMICSATHRHTYTSAHTSSATLISFHLNTSLCLCRLFGRLVGVGCAALRNAGRPQSVRHRRRFRQPGSGTKILICKWLTRSHTLSTRLSSMCVDICLQNTEDYLFQVILEKTIRIPRSLSVKAANVLKAFLEKKPTERLGCTGDDPFLDIAHHPFFRSIEWEAVSSDLSTLFAIHTNEINGIRDEMRFHSNWKSFLSSYTSSFENRSNSCSPFVLLSPLLIPSKLNSFYSSSVPIDLIAISHQRIY